tara:strand:+ start:45935 stop:47098 length:1164 start_codon:yes stop_codon:yes gene_type:complete
MHRINIGGPTYHAAYLTKFLDKEIFETLLISGNINDNEESGEYILNEMDVSVKYINNMYRKINLFRDYYAYKEIKKIIKLYNPDIVHTHAAKPGFIGRLAANNLKVPIIIHTFHGHVFHSYFNFFKTRLFIFLERFLAKKTTKIIAISNAQKNELSKIYKIAKPEKIQIINLGFNLERFSTNTEVKRDTFRNEFNLKDDEIAIGIIGRLTAIKNQILFLDVIKFLKNNSSKEIKAFIIGDGEDRSILESYAMKIGLEYTTERNKEHLKELCFTSWRKDIDVINCGLDIICLTSLNEGTPVSLIEAMAAGKPIVSTNVGGVEDIVEDSNNGFLVNNNVADFSDKVLKLVESKTLRDKMSSMSKKKATEKFSYLRLVDDIENLYKTLIK